MPAVIVTLLCYLGFAGAEPHPTRVFRLSYQAADFVVPAGEEWQLRWSSPYHPGDICPAYDVRVLSGPVRLGENGRVRAQAFDALPGKSGNLDLTATHGQAVVWLESGARFSIANELLRIEVRVFRNH